LNVNQIGRINHDPVESDVDSAPAIILDTKDRVNWNGNLDISNDSEEDCGAAVDYDIEQNSGIEDAECTEQQHLSATPNVSGLIWPTRQSKRQVEKVFVTVDAIEMWRNKGVKIKQD
jgi:hypothetical protein